MECLFGFASSVSRDLVCGALNQLRYPCCSKNFVKRLEEEESNLIITKDSVQKFVTHNKKQARKPSEIVDKWLEDAINDVHNVNQLLEEARTQKHCCFGHCPNWIWRYHVGKKLANKTMHLEKFIKEGREYVPFDRIATLPSNTLDILSEKCMNFESRQSAYEQLLDAVKNNDVSMIGLYGMGGCGKTTLAMEVRKLVEAEHLFDKVLFVPVSSTVEVQRIQEKIASSLPFEFPETEEMQRAQRLCSRLTQEKNIFIILDDVWHNLDFGRIGIPSSEHHKGCKILITSRSEAVCTLMDCQRKIYLPILTDEEAWTLFQNKALITEATSDTLKDLGRLISNECKGLPVAIAAVACSLKGKAETVWRVALNKLRHSKPINIERGLTDPYKCLQLSYDNLDDKEAKSLFLLCSVFPEDSEIIVERLVRCAIGLGVVGEVDSYEEARNEVIAAKIKLVSCCLLLDADDERVKMHDIVRDVAHIIAKDENKMIKCEVEKDVRVEQNSVRYLWCVKFPNDLDCSNLEFLCLRTKMKEFDGIFKRMGMLKVLILVNDEYGRTPLLTISFETLTNLRYLFILNYELSDFSFLGGMKNLQSLSLYNCLLPSFPELQTDVAITLKLLDLNGCNIKVKNFEVIKRIPLLEELYIIEIEGEWDANSVDNIEFFKTFSIPETLQRYGIVLGPFGFEDFDGRDIYIHGRTLLLNHFDISNEVIKGLAKRAKDLFVATIHGGAKNIIPDIFQLEGGGLDELNKLKIRDSEELECLIDTHSHSSEVVTLFSKLHTLGIENMRNLRVIWHCFLPANGPFEKLEKLYLSDCPRLTSLFTYVVARSLIKLKILEISRCDELKYILADDDKTEEGEDEFTTGHPVQIFQNLQDVQINSCRELKHIFPANIVGGLGQLKVLMIEECDKLDQIIGDIVPSTDRDKVIEEGTLSSLTSLMIERCGKLGSIFTASIAKNLTSLEELYIRRCKSLKDIVTHERVNKNQEESIVEDEHDVQSDISIFQSLKNLRIIDCVLLEGIFPVSFVGELNDITNKEVADLKDFSSRNNTQIELPALQVLELHHILVGSYDVICPSLRTLSLDIGRYVGFFNINCSSDASEATKRDCIAIKISNTDFDPPVESVECLSKQPHGLNLIMTHNIREIELKGFDKAKYLFKLSIASSLTMLEILTIKNCGGLEYIIDTDDEYGKENMKAIFPNLKELSVYECSQLKYMFGQYDVANKDYKEIHIQFSALERLCLRFLPKFVSICSTNNLIVTWPSLRYFECYECLYPFYGSREPIITSTKDPKGIQNHLPTLQTLYIMDSDAERIFCLNEHEMIDQQVNLSLKDLVLRFLPQMTYIWVGPNNSLTLQHLITLEIWNCGKLEVIFPKSVVRCLPELKNIIITKCMELKQIMEEDESNLLHIDGGCEVEDIIGCDKEASNNYFAFPNLEELEIFGCAKLEVIFPKSVVRCLPKLKLLTIKECKELRQIIEKIILSPQPCFPKLEALHVEDCHKLKRLFSGSASNDLPNLHLLAINGANELEELVGCKQVKIKVELPRLKLLIFMHLENFSQELHNVKNCIVYKCPKLSLTSTTTFEKLLEDFPYKDFINTEVGSWIFEGIVKSINDSSESTSSQKIEDVGNESIKSSSTGVEDIGIGGAVATHIAKVVEQDDKQEGIYVAPNNNNDISSASADIRTRLGAYKHFVHLDDAQISLLVEAITTYPHLWNASKKFSERFQAWRLKILADMLLFLHKESDDSVIPQREKEFDKLCEEAIEIGFESSWVEEMRQRVVGRDPKLEEDIAQRQIDENSMRCISGDVVEEGDGPKISLEEGSDLVDKEGEIGVVANDHILAPRNEEPEQEFFAEVFTSEIPRIATSLTNSQTVETPSNSIEQVAVEETIAKNTNMAASSIFSESTTSKLDPTVTLLSKSHPHHEIGDVRNDSIKEGPAAEGVEDIGIGGGVATHIESGGVDILAQYSKVVEQDDKMNEGKAGILPSPDCTEAVEIGFESSWVDEMRQRVVMRDPKLREDIAQRQIEENSKRCSSGNMVQDSQAVERADGPKISLEEGVASNDHIGTLTNEEAEEEFVAEVSTSEIPRIATTLTSSQPVERSTPSCLNMPLRETPQNALVDKQRIIEPSLMNQQNPFGEISEIRSSQTEEGIGTNDVISLFASEKESEDSPVGKTLAELEKFMKMSLKDVISSETDTLRLWSTLNLLSNLPFKDLTLSDGLKRIIDTMLQHFPTILRSFKQGFATTDKLGKLEACQNEVATTLVSKISEAENFYNEAQLKEVVLKEQIKVYEAALSSLEKEKNKCIAETIGYKKELENVMKDRSQMLEDKRKVEQELFDVAYKWSNLCSEYELNRMAATNIQ
ncbi:Disease resistance protein [Vigna angularis]|uniref:Disease resistance protein n=1 Tax=Phaseolus angularis TaxID=3914 RepID=A0A8T0JMZ9_PHAAN|nr:Disease resistance protein [Vigna angularis]